MRHSRRALLTIVLLALGACDDAPEERVRIAPAPAATFTFARQTPSPTPITTPLPTPTPTPSPASTPTPTPAATAAPTPSATRAPSPAPTQRPAETARGTAFVIGDGVAVRSAPTTKEGEVVARLGHLQEVQLLGSVKGERWVVGDQTWPMAHQSWTNTWYRVEDGYIYSAHVFIPRPGEASPFMRGGERRIEVEISTQRLRVFVGEQVVHTAGVTTGKNGFDTPKGRYTVGAWGRVANETMTSNQAAITDPAEEYNVKNVLYTQYFDARGDALHLNYWQPEGFFGTTRTSHGCVGLLLHDAQWLWLFTLGGVRLDIQ